MAKIGIIYEPSVSDRVKLFIQKLQNNGDEIELICKDKFPIADAMFPFLSVLSSDFSNYL